jgi:hypothetical protein
MNKIDKYLVEQDSKEAELIRKYWNSYYEESKKIEQKYLSKIRSIISKMSDEDELQSIADELDYRNDFDGEIGSYIGHRAKKLGLDINVEM